MNEIVEIDRELSRVKTQKANAKNVFLNDFIYYHFLIKFSVEVAVDNYNICAEFVLAAATNGNYANCGVI